MTPTSPVEVCNLALDLLRHNSLVSDITENPTTEEESLASRWYDGLRRAVLRMFPWNFAKTRDSISRNSTAPAFDYDDAYDLPNNYLGMIFVGDEDNPITDFRVEGKQVLVNNEGAASLNICYIKDETEVSKFDPVFLMLLAAELAVVFGNAITGLNKSLVGMEKLRDRWELKARAKNAQENPLQVKHSSPLINTRKNVIRSTQSDGIHLFP